MSRREFNGLCAGFGSFVTLSGVSVFDAATSVASADAGRTVRFRDGAIVPAIGQGSWHIGQGRRPAAEEEEALRTGLSLGMTLIDTSGNYGEGRSENGNVIAIPESGSVVHVKENAVALSLTFTPEELQTLDAAHPPSSP